MAGAMIARPDAVRDRVPRPELDRAEQLQRKAGVSLRVERQRGLVPGKAVAIGELRILFLEVPAVGEQKLAQSFGRPGAEDGPARRLEAAGFVVDAKKDRVAAAERAAPLRCWGLWGALAEAGMACVGS